MRLGFFKFSALRSWFFRPSKQGSNLGSTVCIYHFGPTQNPMKIGKNDAMLTHVFQRSGETPPPCDMNLMYIWTLGWTLPNGHKGHLQGRYQGPLVTCFI